MMRGGERRALSEGTKGERQTGTERRESRGRQFKSKLQGLLEWVDDDSDGNEQERRAGEMASASLGRYLQREQKEVTLPRLRLTSLPIPCTRTSSSGRHSP